LKRGSSAKDSDIPAPELQEDMPGMSPSRASRISAWVVCCTDMGGAVSPIRP